jgi:hypothetical protein
MALLEEPDAEVDTVPSEIATLCPTIGQRLASYNSPLGISLTLFVHVGFDFGKV